MRLRHTSLCAASALALQFILAHGAAAQSARPAASAGEATTSSVDEVVVTGSRLMKSGFTEPQPVTVQSAEQLQARSPASLGEAIAQLPAFHGSTVTSNLGAVSSSVGGAQALLNLRGLGSNRVLILLDGERLPASNVNGSVDINIIPSALLSRVDVVTGGASASYGSEAVAGVVNFVLNHKFSGVELNINGGETSRSDAQNGHVTLALGHAFMDGRLRLEGSLEYFKEDAIGLGPNGRGWFDNGSGFVTLPAGSATTFGLIPNVRFATMTTGGLVTKVTSTAGKTVNVPGLSGMMFGAGGALTPFNAGTNTGSAFQSGGDGAFAANGFSPEQEREGAFFHGEYDLTDHLTVFAEALYNRSYTNSVSADPFEQTTKAFTIYADNAFLSPTQKALLAANNVASFNVGRYSSDLPPIVNRDTTTLSRFNVGLRGDLSPRWSYDASLAYAESEQDYRQQNTINRNLYAAADAVVNPANGQTVCRSTLAGLDPGCVPINVLGVGSVSAAGAAYVAGFDDGDTVDKQTAFEANIRGDLGDKFQLGAGPINLAAGVAWRRDHIVRTVSPLSATFTSCTGLRAGGCDAYNNVYGGYQSYNPGPLDGAVSATEGYVEFGIPILKDVAFAKSVNLDLAGRMTDYSTSGVTYTWKIGPTWDVTDDFRLRATRSQDIRAPTANELFSSVASSSTQSTNVFPNSTAPGPLVTTTTTLSVGNINLKPEVAQTYTLGAVYKPSFIPGLQGSLDYYNIDIEDAITTIASQTIVNNCSSGDPSYCALITVGGKPITTTAGLNGAGGIVIASAPQNVANIKTSGYDAELAYTHELLGGRLNLHAIENYVDTFSNSSALAPNGPTFIGALGIGSGLPRWTLDLNEQFERPVGATSSISVNLLERVIAGGQYNPNYTAAQFPTSQQEVPSRTYTNLTVTYKFEAWGGREELYLNVLNIFDVNPPSVPGPSTFQQPTRFDLYDVLGRRFTLGLKAKW